MRRVLTLTVGLALTIVLATSGGAEAKRLPGPTSPLSHEGRWITDAKGRVAIFHGLNMVYKLPPYTPQAAGFGSDDAKFLRKQGFNAVRLGIIYKGVEPSAPVYAGAYDGAYLGQIHNSQKTLAKQGVYSLLDFHQDLYNERFQGEGWPDWAVDDDGLPAEPKAGFPGNYLVMAALNHAFDHFWANDQVSGEGLQDAYAGAWRHVAGLFKGTPYLLGYDLLNEPWPGSDFSSCFNPAGCPTSDADLNAFTKRTIGAIRQADSKTLAFYEPYSTFNFGAGTNIGDVGDPSAAMSFHVYCLQGIVGIAGGCDTLEEIPFQNADKQSQSTGDAQMMTEFGATDDLTDLQRVTDLADKHMTSWLEWAYCGCDDPTTSGPGAIQALVLNPHKPPSGDNVKLDKLKVLERPYPQAVAGTPKSYGFDPGTHTFKLDYSAKAPDGGRLPRKAKSVISIPEIQYPDGYRVDVTGAIRTSKKGASSLKLRRKRGASEVELIVTPR